MFDDILLFANYGTIPEHKKPGAHIKWWKGFVILLVTIYFTNFVNKDVKETSL